MIKARDLRHASSHPKDETSRVHPPHEEVKEEETVATSHSHPRRFTHQDEQVEDTRDLNSSQPEVEDQATEEENQSDDSSYTSGAETPLKDEAPVPPEEDRPVKMNVYSEETLEDPQSGSNSFADDDTDETLSDLSAKYQPDGGVNPSRPRRFSQGMSSSDRSQRVDNVGYNGNTDQRVRQSADEDYEDYNSAGTTAPQRSEDYHSTVSQAANPRGNFQIPSSGVYSGGRQPKSNKLKFLILLIIGLLVIGGSVYSLKGKMGLSALKGLNPFKSTPTSAPVAQVEETPTPIPSPNFDRSQFKIRVLNGTPKTGLAGSTADTLKGLGYQIDKTANATNSAFPQTVVLVKPDDASLSAQLIQDLSSSYQATTSGELKASDTADGEVILGAK